MVEVNWNRLKIPRKQTASYQWSAPYAATVHEGATLRNGTELPSRPWVDHAVQEFDAPAAYVEAFRQSGDFAEAFEEMAQQFGETAQEAITSEIWEWPRPTTRSDGTVVTSPRDIVDEGDLRGSYSMSIEVR